VTALDDRNGNYIADIWDVASFAQGDLKEGRAWDRWFLQNGTNEEIDRTPYVPPENPRQNEQERPKPKPKTPIEDLIDLIDKNEEIQDFEVKNELLVAAYLSQFLDHVSTDQEAENCPCPAFATEDYLKATVKAKPAYEQYRRDYYKENPPSERIVQEMPEWAYPPDRQRKTFFAEAIQQRALMALRVIGVSLGIGVAVAGGPIAARIACQSKIVKLAKEILDRIRRRRGEMRKQRGKEEARRRAEEQRRRNEEERRQLEEELKLEESNQDFIRKTFADFERDRIKRELARLRKELLEIRTARKSLYYKIQQWVKESGNPNLAEAYKLLDEIDRKLQLLDRRINKLLDELKKLLE
jgi:hypothetical protein